MAAAALPVAQQATPPAPDAVQNALRAQAREKAFEEGRMQGLRAGREAAAAELAQARQQLEAGAAQALGEQLAALQRVMQALQSQQSRLMAAAEEDLIAMSFEAVCGILGERACDPGIVAARVGALLAGADRESDGAVHLHPSDAAALQAAGCALPQGWSLVADEEVQLGGALLRGGTSSLDARLETQVELLRRTLRTVRARQRAEGA